MVPVQKQVLSGSFFARGDFPYLRNIWGTCGNSPHVSQSFVDCNLAASVLSRRSFSEDGSERKLESVRDGSL